MFACTLKAIVRSLWLPIHSLKLPVYSLWLHMRSLRTPVCSLTLLERILWIPLYSLLPFSCSLRIYLPKTLMTFDFFNGLFIKLLFLFQILSLMIVHLQSIQPVLRRFQLPVFAYRADNRIVLVCA